MAKTIRSGYLLKAGAGSSTVHSAAGRLLAFLITHAQGTVQAVTFYDDTAATAGTEIAVICVDPTETPIYIEFERNAGIPFDTGLHIQPGNCNVNVWSVDHG